MRKLLIFILGIACFSACGPAADSDILPEDFFVKYYGDSDAEVGLDVIETSSGYLIMGSTTSQNLTERFGSTDSDFYLVFTDKGGNEISSKVHGDANDQIPGSIKPTSDGGYIMIGTTVVALGGTDFNEDIIVYKLDANGDNSDDSVWPLKFGSLNGTQDDDDQGADIVEVDDGFVLVGSTESVDRTKQGYIDGTDLTDIYLHKITTEGERDWELVFGFEKSDNGKAIINTESGFAILGETEVEKDGSGGGTNVIFATTDAMGGSEQFRAFGSGDGTDTNDYPSRIRETEDGGFIIVGTSSDDALESATDDDDRIILMKVTANRTLTYFETISIGDGESTVAANGKDVFELAAGGFLVVGKREGGDLGGDNSGEDMFLVKTNSFGQVTDDTGALLEGSWHQKFGGLGDDEAAAVLELSDGKLIVVGTNDFGGTNSTMMTMMKLNRNGQLLK